MDETLCSEVTSRLHSSVVVVVGLRIFQTTMDESEDIPVAAEGGGVDA